ncbi:methyl-accepting chemotaxis protein [Vibrio sp. SCSIO 43136]|uniref:methyl-accepting chemotaxis protein n=1 Tax=Vibrio sp. SCSIO 43136 TaxID=2819101 RepID=UPI002075BD2F|nr:methyl-accepting chemotaxis protein [Vibrio sp. SCSIO 43136]USD66485.1 methyl-accepting chemotaxis protein [Vibrio sp. SCSIO 43136]
MMIANSLQRIGFKIKLLIVVFCIVAGTITTSNISANYFISDYIKVNEQSHIESQLNVIRDVLSESIEQKILLAQSLTVKLTNIEALLESTDFEQIYKLSYGMIFDRHGELSASTHSQDISARFAASTDKLSVSNIYRLNDAPHLAITVRHSEGAADMFVINLNTLTKKLEDMTVAGSFLELKDQHQAVVFTNKIDGDLTAFQNTIRVHDHDWMLTGYIDQQAIQQNVAKINQGITLSLLSAALGIIPISVLMLHLTMKPIASLRDIVTDLAQGDSDLTKRLIVRSQDDLGKISQSINLFIEKLQTLLISVKDAESQINTQTNQLSQQTQASQQILLNHTTETEQAAAAVAQMSQSADAVASSANVAAQLTNQASSEVERSHQAVSSAISSVENLTIEVEKMEHAVHHMNQETQTIGKVLSVIGEIAEQTNLLALNAAIEAARAGEQGRGFAVVADEVRSLAARTQSSTFEIQDMLAKLHQGSEEVVFGMEATRTGCQLANRRTEEVRTALEVVSTSVQEIDQLASSISLAASEQNTVSDEINQIMSKLQSMIEQLNYHSDSTQESAIHLNTTQCQLADIVTQFKLR